MTAPSCSATPAMMEQDGLIRLRRFRSSDAAPTSTAETDARHAACDGVLHSRRRSGRHRLRPGQCDCTRDPGVPSISRIAGPSVANCCTGPGQPGTPSTGTTTDVPPSLGSAARMQTDASPPHPIPRDPLSTRRPPRREQPCCSSTRPRPGRPPAASAAGKPRARADRPPRLSRYRPSGRARG